VAWNGESGSRVDTEDEVFDIEVLATLQDIDPGADYSAQILSLFTSSPYNSIRQRAAQLAARLPFERVRTRLFDAVRRSPSFEVRRAAAQSLLTLGDVHPSDLSDHVEIYASLRGQTDRLQAQFDARRARKSGHQCCLTIEEPPPTPVDRAQFARAAGLIEDLLAKRHAARQPK
jgi:hypothetical protein